jgi:hypothetical protein
MILKFALHSGWYPHATSAKVQKKPIPHPLHLPKNASQPPLKRKKRQKNAHKSIFFEKSFVSSKN